MPDPLDALRLPVVPVEPRPEFAAALLRRMEGLAEPAARQAATVRYFVTDLAAAVAFYRDLLGFDEELRPSPAFAMLYRGDLRVQVLLPRVVGILGQRRHRRQAALLPGGAPPVVGQLVPGHSDQPGDRHL